jgi:DNA-binding CsgD family transcriptional regulator
MTRARSRKAGAVKRYAGDPLAGFVVHARGDSFLVLSTPMTTVDATMLSPAERSIVVGVVAGQSNAEIARARSISPRTVANHLAAIFRKLRVSSRAELAARISIAQLMRRDAR